MNNTIPRWNLDSIFPGLDTPEYRQALADYTAGMDTIDKLLDLADRFTREANSNFDFAKWLSSFLDEEDKLLSQMGTLFAYAYTSYSTDTTNPAYMNNLSHIEKISIRAQQQGLKFNAMLLAHQTSLDEFYRRFPQYEEYRYHLNECIEETKHQMSAQEEKLAADLQQTGGDAWGRLQEQIISNLHDENGKTFNEIRNEAYSPDAQARKDAWKKELALLEANRIALAASLNNLKGETITLNKRRHWENALDRSLTTARVSRKTIDALIGALEEALPMWRQYFQAKAQLLRATGRTASESTDKGLAFYDLFAPIADSKDGTNNNELLEKKWTFAEARDYIIKEYNSFSPDMGTFAAHAFDSGWIDAEVRPGKVGGAYDEDFPKGHQSRILTNFTGTFSDIITLAHELGHAYHFSCLKGKAPRFFSYPMTLAETASTFAETIVKQDMLAQADEKDKIKILDLDLQDAAQVLVDILCRFYFERSVFEARAKGELNADDFCRLMREAQEKSYGNGLNEERHEYMWALKSHYYSTGFDFYNYPYAFGQLFAAGLYARSRKEGASFAKTYSTLLADTGSMSCEALCQKAGFDITRKDFWQEGIAMYAKEVSLFTSLATA